MMENGNEKDPFTEAPVPNNLRPVPNEDDSSPDYLPQKKDVFGQLTSTTGTRPVVDKYSFSRFSVPEWRARNKRMLDMSRSKLNESNLIDWNARTVLKQVIADTDENQETSTRRLLQREQEIHKWKSELETAIEATEDEISLTERERRRLQQAMRILLMPESIATECLNRRTCRLDEELVHDEVEAELMREVALCAEVRQLLTNTLREVEDRLVEIKNAKKRLEFDWSDKKEAKTLEIFNVSLNNQSNLMLFKRGAARFAEQQSTPELWENFTRNLLGEAEAARQRSAILRSKLDAILTNSTRDLRCQANNVEAALSKRIASTDGIRNQLEIELRKVLQSLVDVETLMKDLQTTIRNIDVPMKIAQTRLDCRSYRLRVENCRDVPQYGLMEEVGAINDDVSSLKARLREAERSQEFLVEARNKLEREILLKRKTLETDRERTEILRTHFPSVSALSGY